MLEFEKWKRAWILELYKKYCEEEVKEQVRDKNKSPTKEIKTTI